MSGFLEQALVELLLEHTRSWAAKSVHQYTEATLRRFTNAKTQKVIDLLGSFQIDWRKNLEAFLIDERKAALDSIVDLRNTIAHGRSVGVTLNRVRTYYIAIQEVIDRVTNLCA